MVAPAVCEPAAAPSATLRASCSQLSPIPESPRALLLASPGPRLLDSPIRNNPQQQQQQLVQQNAALVAEVEDLKVRLSLAERASAWCGASPAARALFRWRRRTSLTREHGRMATSLQNWEEQLLAISDELSASAASLCQQLAEVHRESAALARESTAEVHQAEARHEETSMLRTREQAGHEIERALLTEQLVAAQAAALDSMRRAQELQVQLDEQQQQQQWRWQWQAVYAILDKPRSSAGPALPPAERGGMRQGGGGAGPVLNLLVED